MTEERRRVLDMLSEEKITVEEAERLLQALTRKGRGIDAPLSPIPNGGIDAPLSPIPNGGIDAPLSPIPNVGATLSGWSESDKGGKTSKRDDTFAVGANPRPRGARLQRPASASMSANPAQFASGRG